MEGTSSLLPQNSTITLVIQVWHLFSEVIQKQKSILIKSMIRLYISGDPDLFAPLGTFGILIQGGGHNDKMVTTGGGAIHTMLGIMVIHNSNMQPSLPAEPLAAAGEGCLSSLGGRRGKEEGQCQYCLVTSREVGSKLGPYKGWLRPSSFLWHEAGKKT